MSSELLRIESGQTGHPLAQGLYLQHARLHLPELARHGIEVLAHVDLFRIHLALCDQAGHRSKTRPPLAHTFKKHPVIGSHGSQHQQHRRHHTRCQQLQTVQVQRTALGQPGIRDNDVHNSTFRDGTGFKPEAPRSHEHRPTTSHHAQPGAGGRSSTLARRTAGAHTRVPAMHGTGGAPDTGESASACQGGPHSGHRMVPPGWQCGRIDQAPPAAARPATNPDPKWGAG